MHCSGRELTLCQKMMFLCIFAETPVFEHISFHETNLHSGRFNQRSYKSNVHHRSHHHLQGSAFGNKNRSLMNPVNLRDRALVHSIGLS